MSATFNQAMQTATQAADFDEKKDFPKALDFYIKAIETLQVVIKAEKSADKKKLYTHKANEILERANQIKKHLSDQNKKQVKQEQNQQQQQENSSKENQQPEPERKKIEAAVPHSEEEKGLMDALDGAIVKSKPNVKWDDVAGLDEAKDALKEAVILPIKYPQLFVGKRTPWKAILMYGPPGTGKSFLAQAVASESNSTFFAVSSADLVSKWQGESEKLVRALFQMAREHKPSIVFIDEIDSMCSSRAEGETDSIRRIKTEFLVQMEGVGKDQSGVLILAATNLPWGIDQAMRRRFEKRVYIPLPDEIARTKMFQLQIGNTPNNMKKEDFRTLGQLTEGYSGSDIKIAVRNGLMEPIRYCKQAKYFRKVMKPSRKNPQEMMEYFTPCEKEDVGAIPMTLSQLKGDDLDPPILQVQDFIKALKTSKATVGKNELQDYITFTEQFGSEG